MSSSSPGAPARSRATVRAVLEALRPAQWTKNLVVLVPGFFGWWDPAQRAHFADDALINLGLATVAFCLASGAIYLLNDVRDAPQDRQDPVKRLRPVADGRITPAQALGLCAAFLSAALLLGWSVGRPLLAVLALYALLQVGYSFGLKQSAPLDVFLIAIGFVLRAVAGAVAARVDISAWLLLCTFLLALFLAFCKRRHEKMAAGANPPPRTVLVRYDLRMLDQAIAICATATVVCYAIYTLSADTLAKFGTRALCATVPFVLFGILRYLDLLYRGDTAGQPEKVLLTDPPMIATLVLYALTAWAAFAWGRFA